MKGLWMDGLDTVQPCVWMVSKTCVTEGFDLGGTVLVTRRGKVQAATGPKMRRQNTRTGCEGMKCPVVDSILGQMSLEFGEAFQQ